MTEKKKPEVTSRRTRNRLPKSRGYILVDSKKCTGCQSCMMACSLVHEGEVNLSLARIQVMQNILKDWPDDVKIAQCRQCIYAPCVESCPTDAVYVDTLNGNIRTIDEGKCIGCKLCIDNCPHPPHRTIWNHLKEKAIKCDLCVDTLYWNEKGGIDGKQACVEVCPVKAIKFVIDIPKQLDDVGYDVDLGQVTMSKKSPWMAPEKRES